jgi:hypothetical protein
MDSLFFDTYEATSTYFLNTLKRAQQECTTYNSAAMVSKNKMLKNISEKAKCEAISGKCKLIQGLHYKFYSQYVNF